VTVNIYVPSSYHDKTQNCNGYKKSTVFRIDERFLYMKCPPIEVLSRKHPNGSGSELELPESLLQSWPWVEYIHEPNLH